VSERIDDLMERMERLVETPGEWAWQMWRFSNRSFGASIRYRNMRRSFVSRQHPTLRAALEDAITQAEKAVADAH